MPVRLAEWLTPAPCGAQLYTDQVPASLLRSDNQGSAMRAKFERMIRQKQDEICAAVEAADGSRFHQDAWTRPGGGGGISRVLQGGKARKERRPGAGWPTCRAD